MPSRSHLLLWPLLVAAMVVASTWPAAWVAGDHLLEPLYLPDVQGGMYWPWAFSSSLLAGESIYHRPELLWPAGQDVRLLIWNHGVQLIIFPLFALLSPVPATNAAALLIATLNGLAGAWAGHRLSGSRAGALLGAAVAVGSPYGFIEAGVGRPEQGLWAPLAVWLGALGDLWRAPEERRHAIIAGLALAAAGAVYWFYAVFALLLLAVMVPLSRPGWMHIRALLLAGAVSVVAVLPFLLPVALALKGGGSAVISDAVTAMGTLDMQTRASVKPLGFLGPLAVGDERSWRLPLLTLPVLIIGLVRGERPLRLIAGCGLLAAVLAAGPFLLDIARQPRAIGLPGAWLSVLPGFDRFWWPYRWQAVAVAACTAVLPALVRHRVAAAALSVLLLVEGAVILRDGGRRAVMGQAEVPALMVALGELPGTHPILQLPGEALRNSRVGWIPWHGQPIDGGMGAGMGLSQGDGGPLLDRVEASSRDPSVVGPAVFTEEEAGGFHYVILYEEGPAKRRNKLRRGLKRVLGEPFYTDPGMAAWAVPGLGEPLSVTSPDTRADEPVVP